MPMNEGEETQEVIEQSQAIPSPNPEDGTERVPLEQDDDVTFDDFLVVKNGIQPPAKKKEEVEGEEVEEAEEVETPENKPEEKAQPQKIEQKLPETPAKFPSRAEQLKELGITDPKDIGMLKKMSNESFAYVTQLIRKSREYDGEIGKYKTELETLKTKTPEPHHPTLYHHPEGYKLSPKYNETLSMVNKARGVLDHWVEQMAKIRRGEKWSGLQADKDGNIFVSDEESEGDARAEVYVSKELAVTQQFLAKYENQLQGIQESHINSRKADEAFIKQQEERFFPGYDDPKHETAEAQKMLRERLPGSMQDYVPTSIFVKTVANNAKFAQKVQQLEAELAKYKGAAKPANGQPTKNKFVAGKPQSKQSSNPLQDDEITYEDFVRARNRR